MFKRINYLVLLILFFSISKAQNQVDYSAYYLECNKALELKLKGEYKESINIYESVFDKYFPFPDDLEELKENYLLTGDKDNAYKTFERMVLSGYKLEDKSYLISKRKFISGIKHHESKLDSLIQKEINRTYDSLRIVFLSGIDVEKDKYLQSIGTIDSFIGELRRKGEDVGSLAFETNAIFFLSLIKSGNVPSRIESDSWDDILNVSLIHILLSIDTSQIDNYFIFLQKHIKLGNFSPIQYAIFYDQYYVRILGNENSFYGHFFSSEPLKILNIDNPLDLDKRRANMFLPPLWVWAKWKNLKLPDNYTPIYN